MDRNNDGIRDPNEHIPNWDITITDPVNQSTTTDNSGYFYFMNITVGTYTVSELPLPSGYTIVSPSGGSYSNIVVSPGSVVELEFDARQ